MKMLLSISFTFLLMPACTYSDINFERMSKAELAAYNQGRNIAQMIVCSDESRAFSRVRVRRCFTVEQMYGSADQAAQLGVLNAIPGYSGTRVSSVR